LGRLRTRKNRKPLISFQQKLKHDFALNTFQVPSAFLWKEENWRQASAVF